MKQLVLPGGLKLTAPDEMALNREFARHGAAAITEGLCPWHGTPLKPVKARPPQIGGHCAACARYWRYDPSGDEEIGRSIDTDPRTGQPWVPDWVLNVPEWP